MKMLPNIKQNHKLDPYIIHQSFDNRHCSTSRNEFFQGLSISEDAMHKFETYQIEQSLNFKIFI